MTRSIAGVVLLVSLATPLRAQLVPPPNAPKALCFRGRPLPQCRAFWLTEFGLSLPDGPFGWELGGMRNVGKRSAVGGTLYLRIDGGTAYGVKPMYFMRIRAVRRPRPGSRARGRGRPAAAP